MMEMRPSRVLDKLRAGKTASCVKLNCADSRVFEVAAQCGFDCLWTDQEHIANSQLDIERQVLAAKANGADLMVRVARGSYSDYIRPLELDAAGIMVPHVMGLEDARQVVRTTRFHPVGLRPVDGGNADAKYCGVPFEDYLKQANARRFVILQIEDLEPMAELDAICALEGVDVIFFGPGDFSQSIGDPGNFSHPRLLEARRLVAETAIKHGKFAGTVGSPGNIAELHALGYRLISLGADVVGLAEYFTGLLASYKAL